jgi:hypothetical protein
MDGRKIMNKLIPVIYNHIGQNGDRFSGGMNHACKGCK